jgi:hypothetical protein
MLRQKRLTVKVLSWPQVQLTWGASLLKIGGQMVVLPI